MQPLQKLRSQILLQPPQSMAGGGLRIAQLRRGVGDVAQLGGPGEQFQIVDIHKPALCLCGVQNVQRLFQ